MQATPSTWRLLLDAGWRGSAPRLAEALAGGEAVPAGPRRRARSTRPRRLWNMYGPTETTIWSTRAPARGGERRCRSGGRSPARMSTCSTERSRRSRSACRASSTSAARGSPAGTCDRPELTAERFLPDPFASGAEGRAALPDGRPGAVAARRHARMPGPRRHSGEAAGLPHRAGRDRGGAVDAPGASARPWRVVPGRRPRRPAARRLPGAAGEATPHRRPLSCAPGTSRRGCPSTWCPRHS